MKTHHTTKDGQRIPLSELSTDHLINIIKLIEKKADEGFAVLNGHCGHSAEDTWADQDFYYDDTAKQYFGYDSYVNELNKRKNNPGKTDGTKTPLDQFFDFMFSRKYYIDNDLIDEHDRLLEIEKWHYKYIDYIAKTYPIIDAEACGYADGDDEYKENML